MEAWLAGSGSGLVTGAMHKFGAAFEGKQSAECTDHALRRTSLLAKGRALKSQ